MTRWLYAASAASLVFLCSAANADEGMWPFHGFPFDKVNTALKTHLDQAGWIARAWRRCALPVVPVRSFRARA